MSNGKTKSQPALSSKSLPLSPSSQREKDRRTASKASDDLASPLAAKTFSQLTAAEKDNLLEAIALRLSLVKPA